jgi:hypothetical protein
VPAFLIRFTQARIMDGSLLATPPGEVPEMVSFW